MGIGGILESRKHDGRFKKNSLPPHKCYSSDKGRKYWFGFF